MKQKIDLNSDMSEGFGPWSIGDGVDDEIMPLISSANIATGFHAGDPNTMQRMVGLAAKHNVGVGAHPGFRDRVGFGHRHINATDEDRFLLLGLSCGTRLLIVCHCERDDREVFRIISARKATQRESAFIKVASHES